MMHIDYAVKTKNLSKLYQNKAAVSQLNMEVQAGDIYGFIGPNGAGKSTTLKMLCGLVHPTEGEISLFGSSVNDETIRRRIGILIEDAGLYPNLSARENMILKANCQGITDMHKVDELLDMMQLSGTGKKKTAHFSMGMKQRLGIAMALLGNPDLLILDEPINGLDPEGIREIRLFLKRLNEETGKTIIISSHILGELSKLATKYGIIKEGKLIQQLSKEELEDQCQDYLLLKVDQTDRAVAVLSEKLPEADYEIFDQGQLRLFHFTDSGAVTTLLVQNGITVNACSLHQKDLEHYFLDLMEGGHKNV